MTPRHTERGEGRTDLRAERARIRRMGGRFCGHAPGTCTADPDWQAYLAEMDRPDAKAAAEEIGRLITRILALAPDAGLYVGIKVEPKSADGEVR